jgi:hypothetical protein
MALVIRGKTICRICGKVIGKDDEVAAFPAFVGNQKDPFYRFNDGAFHQSCFEALPESEAFNRRYREMLEHSGPGHRACSVCGEQIMNPDDYFGFGFLTDAANDPLSEFNYVHLHRSHIKDWPVLDRAVRLIEELNQSGCWEGSGLKWVLGVLREAQPQQ